MTIDETKMLLMTIESLYPSWKPVEIQFTIKAWHQLIADYDFKTMQAALYAYVSTDTKGFAPSPGQLKSQIPVPNDMTALEAWSMVYGRIGSSIYHAKENFESLPDTIKRAVGSADVLRQWAMTDSSQLTVIQANFIKTYNNEKQKQSELMKIPASVRNVLSTAANKLLLGEVNDGTGT